MNSKHLPFIATLVLVNSVFLGGRAKAADPTTADCLAASDASLKAGNEHKLRAERGQLLICAATSCPADIRNECLRRVDEVNAAIPTVIFETKDAAGNDLSAVKVTIDGELLVDRLEGTALSIDPGEHTFLFEASGMVPVTKQFVIREAQKDRREAITFSMATGALSAAPVPSTAQAIQSFATIAPAAPEPAHRLGAQKIVALVAGGIGVVGLGVGSAFGLIASSKKNDAQAVCPGQCPTAAGVSDWSDAKSAGNVSTALFIVGGVGLAGAAVLWFTAPSTSRGSGPQFGVSPSGLQLRGTW